MTPVAHEAIETVVAAAAKGDERAWNELVGRYMPLVRSVIRRHGLTGADAADVNQTLWLRLVEHLDTIISPAALPMWIIQTTRRECLRMLRLGRRTWPVPDAGLHQADPTEPDERLLRQERHQVLREGFTQLPPRCQELLAMLTADPPVSYAQISQRLGMPVGSIGPTRARCLHKLRSCPVVSAFLEAHHPASDAHRPADQARGAPAGPADAVPRPDADPRPLPIPRPRSAATPAGGERRDHATVER